MLKQHIGMDIHKHFVMIVGVDANHEVVLTSRRVSTKQLGDWAKKNLTETDEVIMEATSNVWVLHDLVCPHVKKLTVVHPFYVKIITGSFVKTDKKDALALARLLVTKLAPAIWISLKHVRELRSLISHRKHLVKQRTAAKNRLQGIIFRYNLTAPTGDLYAQINREWWYAQELSPIEALRIRQDLQTIDFFTQQIEDVESLIAQLSITDEWAEAMACVMQLPGVALVSAMTILSAIGDIERFATAKN